MQEEKYKTSFVVGSLFIRESLNIASLYLETSDWDKVHEIVIRDNIIQARTVSSLIRINREICFRLKALDKSELKFFINASIQEQGYILWLAICRYYRLIREFAVDVVRERYLTLRHDLNLEDFDAFYNAKAEWHEELEKNTPSTRNKLRQVVFRMLREADLLSKDNIIKAAMLTPQMLRAITRCEYQNLYIFPVMESELKEWLT